MFVKVPSYPLEASVGLQSNLCQTGAVLIDDHHTSYQSSLVYRDTRLNTIRLLWN